MAYLGYTGSDKSYWSRINASAKYNQQWAEEREAEEEEKRKNDLVGSLQSTQKTDDGSGNGFISDAIGTVSNIGGGFRHGIEGALSGAIALGAGTADWAVSNLMDRKDELEDVSYKDAIEQAQKNANEYLGIKNGQSFVDRYKGGNPFDEKNLAGDEETKAMQARDDASLAHTAGEFGADVATMVMPAMKADKLVRGTKTAQKLLSGNKLARTAGEVGVSVGGGSAATAVGAISDPTKATGEDALINTGIDAAIGAATPLVATGVKALRSARNAAQASVPSTDDVILTLNDLSTADGRRSPAVTREEFMEFHDAGKAKYDELRAEKAEPDAIIDDNSFRTLVDDAYNNTRGVWDGETYNAKTGEKVAKDADAYVLSIRDKGVDSVTISPNASKEEFAEAMEEARKRFADTLTTKDAHLGVFNDGDTGMIDIDPVYITDKLQTAQELGAYTRATGGAFHIKSGDGYWPPHVADDAVATSKDGVVQTVDPETGKKVFYRVTPEQHKTISQQIDGVGGEIDGIAGHSIDGTRYHVTASKPSEMMQAGFEDGGMFDTKMLSSAKLRSAQRSLEEKMDDILTGKMDDIAIRSEDADLAEKVAVDYEVIARLREIDEIENSLMSGNYGDDLFDISTQRGGTYTADNANAALQKQIDTLENRKVQLREQLLEIDGTTDEGLANIRKIDDIVAQLDAEIGAIKSGDTSAISRTLGDVTGAELNIPRLKEKLAAIRQEKAELMADVARAARVRLDNTFTIEEVPSFVREASPADIARITRIAPQAETLDDIVDVMPSLEPRLKPITDEIDGLKMERDTLMTPEKAQQQKAMLDAELVRAKEALKEATPERQAIELRRLEENYQIDNEIIESELADSAERISGIDEALSGLQAQSDDIVAKYNYAITENPSRFEIVDSEAVEQVSKQKYDTAVVEGAPGVSDSDGEMIAKSVDHDTVDAQLSYNEAYQKVAHNTAESADTLSNVKVSGKMNYWASPTDKLRQMGPIGERMADIITNAHMGFSQSRSQTQLMIRDIAKTLKTGNGDKTNVIRALDGKIEPGVLNDAENAAYYQLRAYFDDAAEKLGLSPEMRVSEYLPHIFEQRYKMPWDDIVERVGIAAKGVDSKGRKYTKAERLDAYRKLDGIDSQTATLIMERSGMKVENGFLKARTGAEGYEETDLVGIIDRYDHVLQKKVHYEPAFEEARLLSKPMTDAQKEYAETLIKKMNGRDTNDFVDYLDSYIGPGVTAKVLGGYRNLSNMAIMGASVTTAVRNIQDGSKILADRKLKHVFSASQDAALSMKHNTAQERELFEVGVLDNSFVSFMRNNKAQMEMMRPAGIAKKAWSRFQDTMWFMMHNVDKHQRATNYFAAKREFLESPAGKLMARENPEALEQAAREYGWAANRDTMFTFSNIDIPTGMNNPIGRSLLNMQTYNMQTTKYAGKKLKSAFWDEKRGKIVINPEETVKLMKYVTANAAWIGFAGATMGMQLKDSVPFGNEISEGRAPQSPLAALLFGNSYNPGLKDVISETLSGKESALETAGDFAQAAIGGLIPGSVQFNRTKKGLESTAGDGYATSESGNIQFKQDQDAVNRMTAALFGKNATQAGGEWRSNDMPSLNKYQMQLGNNEVDINSLPAGAKEGWVNFYNAINTANPYNFDTGKNRRQSAKSEAMEAFANGDMNRAKRAVDEYNQQAAEIVGGFVEENNGTMPEEMLLELERLFIQYEDIAE